MNVSTLSVVVGSFVFAVVVGLGSSKIQVSEDQNVVTKPKESASEQQREAATILEQKEEVAVAASDEEKEEEVQEQKEDKETVSSEEKKVSKSSRSRRERRTLEPTSESPSNKKSDPDPIQGSSDPYKFDKGKLQERADKADPYNYSKGGLQDKVEKKKQESTSTMDDLSEVLETPEEEPETKALPIALIDTMLRNHRSVKTCFLDERKSSGQLPNNINIRFQVEASGVVSRSYIVDGAFVGSSFESCLRRALAEIRFPPTQGKPKEYTYKFVL